MHSAATLLAVCCFYKEFLFFRFCSMVAADEWQEDYMNQAAPKAPLTQIELKALEAEYKHFIEQLRRKWLRENNHPPRAWVLYELDAQERQRVDGVIRRWEQYVIPIAEKWWKGHGIGIHWPEKSSDPCQLYELEVAQA
jgi:hypothetical protein